MPKRTELFPHSQLFAVEPLESGGVYPLEPQHGHRWLQPKASLLIHALPDLPTSTSWLRLTMEALILLVIPAQAGIQFDFPSIKSRARWTPASARGDGYHG